MTNEQVKDILHEAFVVYIDCLSDDEHFVLKQHEAVTANMIILKALEKQTPIKPRLDKDRGSLWVKGVKRYKLHYWKCPSCNANVGEHITYGVLNAYDQNKMGVCEHCYQAIDWGEK